MTAHLTDRRRIEVALPAVLLQRVALVKLDDGRLVLIDGVDFDLTSIWKIYFKCIHHFSDYPDGSVTVFGVDVAIFFEQPLYRLENMDSSPESEILFVPNWFPDCYGNQFRWFAECNCRSITENFFVAFFPGFYQIGVKIADNPFGPIDPNFGCSFSACVGNARNRCCLICGVGAQRASESCDCRRPHLNYLRRGSFEGKIRKKRHGCCDASKHAKSQISHPSRKFAHVIFPNISVGEY